MRPLLLVATLLLAVRTYAQDNIVLRNGDEIPAKVLEINQSDLKYRKAANPDGPIYTTPLRDVFLVKYANGTKDVFNAGIGPTPAPTATPAATPTPAVAQPGVSGLQFRSHWLGRGRFTDGAGQPLRAGQVRSLLTTQPDALSAYQRGRSLQTWSIVTGASAVALIGTGAVLALDGNRGRSGRTLADQRDDFGRNGRRDERIVGAALAGGGVLVGLTSAWLRHRATLQFRRAAERYTNRPATTLQLTPGYQSFGGVLTF